jgi:hypothetical protein
LEMTSFRDELVESAQLEPVASVAPAEEVTG